MFRGSNWPFVYLLLVPLATVPASFFMQQHIGFVSADVVGLGYGDKWALRDEVIGTLWPAIANLLVLVWLFSGNARSVWAALFGGIVAAGRIALPVGIMMSSSAVGPDGLTYVNYLPTSGLIFVGELELWLAGILVWLMFVLMTRLRDRSAAPAAWQTYPAG